MQKQSNILFINFSSHKLIIFSIQFKTLIRIYNEKQALLLFQQQTREVLISIKSNQIQLRISKLFVEVDILKSRQYSQASKIEILEQDIIDILSYFSAGSKTIIYFSKFLAFVNKFFKMSLENLSIYTFEIVLSFLSKNEIKSIRMINKYLARFLSDFLRKKISSFGITFFSLETIQFPQLSSLQSLHITTIFTNNQDIKLTLKQMPQTVKKLKIQLNYDLIAQRKFYSYISKFCKQISSLKITAVGPNVIETKQNIDVKFIHGQFYSQMKHLEKFKIVTQGLSSIKPDSIQNYLFYALFYNDKLTRQQLSIKKISFDQLADVTKLQHQFISMDDFEKNQTISSIELKQFDSEKQMNLLNQILILTSLFGQQIISLKLCQHINENLHLEWRQLKQFQNYFCNLQNFSLNIYNNCYSILNFTLDDFVYQELNTLGLSSLNLNSQDLIYLISLIRNVKSLNLDFTQLDDNCLLLISFIVFIFIDEQYQLTEIKIRGCKKLTDLSLLPFLEKQRQLVKIDIRGVTGFSKKACRLMIKNCLLFKLSVSNNKMDNQILENVLRKNRLSLSHLNIGELMQNNAITDDVFANALSSKLYLLNLYSLSIQLTGGGFSVCVLKEVLQLIPFIAVLCLRIKTSHMDQVLQEIVNNQQVTNSLQKLVLTCIGYQSTNICSEKRIKQFRDNFKRLDSFTVNLADSETCKLVLSLFRKTQGHNLRIVFPQQNLQYIV